MKKLEKIEEKGTFTILSYLGDLEGCGYLRIIYPTLLLNQLRHDKIKFNAFFLTNFVRDSLFYNNITLVQFQRSATQQQHDIIKFFKENIRPKSKTALFYEIDDLLTDIKEWNYAHSFYKDKEEIVARIMAMCDGVVVSTPKLKEIYSKFNKNIAVRENHLLKCLWGEPKYNEKCSNKPRILWAGSSNHFAVKPLYEKGIKGGDFGDKLLDFIRKTTDKYQWVLVGGFPLELEDIKDKIEFHRWVPINEYPQFLKGIRADVGIAPLELNLFNSAKSNIKALEYIAAGIPGIYTNIDPYENLSCTTNSDEEMIDYIERLTTDEDLRFSTFEKDINTLRDILFWEENDNLLKYVNKYLNLLGKAI